MINFIIYDWNNEPHHCLAAASPSQIVSVDVVILSGDEIVSILDTKGNLCEFDAGAGARTHDFFDLQYSLKSPQDITKWMNWEPSEDCDDVFSYCRADVFMND